MHISKNNVTHDNIELNQKYYYYSITFLIFFEDKNQSDIKILLKLFKKKSKNCRLLGTKMILGSTFWGTKSLEIWIALTFIKFKGNNWNE